ncbi:MAG: hypothetical protein COA32_02650 [Fluviicola sp.]|nr:MAG: hypothetical protein COA32_02650 [Fluviicola sp.]
MNRFTLLIIVLITSINICLAQVPGDTTTVDGLTFSSTTRDTQLVFPTFNANEIERIWMKYTMRCKDAQVSSPIQGQTNDGCGEWDYSCNTYITDSSRIDSVKAVIDRYNVFPFTDEDDTYNTTPTFNRFEKDIYEVSINTVNSENNFSISSFNNETSIINSNPKGSVNMILLTSSQLAASGIGLGNIDAIELNNVSTLVSADHLNMTMQEVSFSDFSAADLSQIGSGTEVYNNEWNFQGGINKIPFYQPFNWTGGNILIMIKSKGLSGDLSLGSSTLSQIQTLSSSTNQHFRFIDGNYIEVEEYKGISGSNPRTVEAWVKTPDENINITSWGENTTGERFTFRLHNDGRLRVEIAGGFVIANTPINDNEWHHVAAVFNGTDLGDVTFYVDGQNDGIGQLNNLTLNTASMENVLISRGFFNKDFNGEMDDVRIWSSALSSTTINEQRFKRVGLDHPNFSSLELNYTFDDGGQNVVDRSANSRDGTIHGIGIFGQRSYNDASLDMIGNKFIPDINLLQADYELTINNITVLDSLAKPSYIVVENILTPNPGTFQSDITSVFYEYWPDSTSTFDLNGQLLNNTIGTNQETLNNDEINYFKRTPSKLEILSLVTPYGINLDLGEEGETWYFDVTDFYPILTGNRGLSMSRGGEWQEEIDIDFLFIHGTPTREVLDLRQIWKVDSKSYTLIESDDVFAPRTIALPSDAAQVIVKSAITGHGQQGEFIPRDHYLEVNSGQSTHEWMVWKECSQNPMYPQGGTWIYDRAGWCPGMPTDVETWDVTNYISSNNIEVDYGVNGASGTSNYIVNNQIVAYGPANFSTDARIVEVEAPNDLIKYGRFNPVCDNPKVKIQNTGTNVISTVLFSYAINGDTPVEYTWTGNISFLEEMVINLPAPLGFWQNTMASQSNQFSVEVKQVNGIVDEYAHNNSYVSKFEVTEQVPSTLIIRFKTNNAASENSYRIEDSEGNIIFERNSLLNNTTYLDTIEFSQGCYKYIVEDSGDDGISFWANNDGSGYMQFRSENGTLLKDFEGDFGGDYVHQFTVTESANLKSEVHYAPSISVFPNPSDGDFQIKLKGDLYGDYEIIDSKGQVIKSDRISKNTSLFQIGSKNWSSGIYVFRFISNHGVLQNKMIKL